MGNCNKGKHDDQAVFLTTLVIYIKQDKHGSKFLPSSKVVVSLTKPFKEFTDICEVGTFRLKIASCVMPGQDPRGEIKKICQDNVFFRQKPDFFLATLFDGHGSKGHEVVSYTEEFMREYFEAEEFTENTAEEFLNDLYFECERSLVENHKTISVYGSGTTCVTLLFSAKGVHVASVGDSRAILSTLPNEPRQVPKQPKTLSNYRTRFKPTRALESIQLTIDQKPNLEEELNRIVNNGGIVSRALDTDGNAYGPYRVFQKGRQIPGLAMSRSLGDLAAKHAGVIAEPIIEKFSLVNFKDQFIVVASDGVWDVMDNNEVTEFVDTFRTQCRNRREQNDDTLMITSDNSTIARLLVEEARLRWMGQCCEEDVVIDDISAIVIELVSKELIEREEDYRESRTCSKSLGSIVEIKSGTSISSHIQRSTMTCFESLDNEEEAEKLNSN